MKKGVDLKQIRCMAFPSLDEDNIWCAVALEVDIWGFGKTAEEAMKDLDDLVDMQIEFATGKKLLSILYHPADKKWFQIWDMLQKIEDGNKQKSNLSSFLQTNPPSSKYPSYLKETECYYLKAA